MIAAFAIVGFSILKWFKRRRQQERLNVVQINNDKPTLEGAGEADISTEKRVKEGRPDLWYKEDADTEIRFPSFP